MKTVRIHPDDNVAVALQDLAKGEPILQDESSPVAKEDIPRGHKVAIRDIAKDTPVIKYGCPIAKATEAVPAGAWVHTHNAQTLLDESADIPYAYEAVEPARLEAASFQGYRRPDGKCGIRNELWVLPLVGCVNGVAAQLVHENQNLVQGTIDGLYAFPHPYGCSQLGGDLMRTAALLSALSLHPNAGGVLLVGLGCENLTKELFLRKLGDYDKNRIRFLMCQEYEDELAEGGRLLRELADYAGGFTRTAIPASELVIGLKCGGSDGLSGVTANPAVGRFSDLLVAMGGSTILTEVPEMFGAERPLFSRCVNREVFDKAVRMIRDFKDYFSSHGQPVYENPSPGNKKGGITTLEDKSLGCIQKGGTAPVSGVLDYGEMLHGKGLHLLYGPGNDLVSATALTAAGAQMILFTTGRGTPFGAPAPTVKIATNTPLYESKKNWIDFNAGTIAEGRESIDEAGQRLLQTVLAIADGKQTATERAGFREISVFHDGVVL